MANFQRFIIAFLLLFALSNVAMAQVVRPPVTEPSRTQQRLQIEQALPPVSNEPLITVPDGRNAKVLGQGASFTLKGVTFEGATVFTSKQLRPEYEKYLGKKVNLATLHAIAADVTIRYRNAGYILSRAVIPPQSIDKGIVKIRIVEGYISKIRFEGVQPSSRLIRDYADKITSERPLNSATLERYLLLMDDLPGVSTRAVVKPSSTSGASDLIITLSQKHFDGSVTLDNRGTRYMGPLEGGLTVNANNMLGLYDRTTVRGVATSNTSEMRYGQIIHEEQLDSDGTKLAASAGYTHTNPGYKLSQFDIAGRDLLFSAEVSHPFIRSRQSNLFGDVKFDWRQTDVSSLSVPLYDDRLRVLRGGGSYDFIDAYAGVNRIESEISQGFNLDASSSVGARSRANGTPDFTKGTFLASRLQPVSGPFSIYAAATGQASSNALMVAEQFGLGGPNFGSAYDPSEITGDSGVAGRLELQYNRSNDWKYIPNYQLYGFYDIGTLWIRAPSAGQKPQESLADTGLGVRFNVMEPLSGDLQLAFPLTRDVAADGQDGKHARVFFSLAYRY